MAVDRVISRAIMEQEVGVALEQAPTFSWIACPDYEALSLRVRITSHDGDVYILHMEFDDYREIPPIVDFVDRNGENIGSKSVFPRSHDTFFHPNGPCICAPINRKAYREIHKEWKYGDWSNSTAQNTNWSKFATVAGILWLIQSRLSRPEYYKGKMQ